MDWFEAMLGFREGDYADVQSKLEVVGDRLRSRINGSDYGIGSLELVSLQALKERARAGGGLPGRLTVQVVQGEVRALHQAPEFAGALFQAASQFNLLEMVGPGVTPEQGVTQYATDGTQGPACAIAAGAATVYRNYFVPVGEGMGQTSERQLDGLADLGAALSDALNLPVDDLWNMQNGYALCSSNGLKAISGLIGYGGSDARDALGALLRIGLHWDVEVSDAQQAPRPIVSQAFCSALPVAYGEPPVAQWESLAPLVLEAAYEATLLAAVCNAQRGGSNIVLLTHLGGGAFGNDDHWINTAIRRALELFAEYRLDVRLVSYRAPSAALIGMSRAYPRSVPAVPNDAASDGPPELILEMGAEGGSLAIQGVRTASGWTYFRELDDQTPQFIGEPGRRSRSEEVNTWSGALALLKPYPWEHLYPLSVHPEFCERVREAILLRMGGRKPRSLRAWQELGVFTT